MPKPTNHTASKLFTQLGQDSPKALEAIIQAYKKILAHYIWRYVQNEELVKEVFQDTMQAVWIQRKEMAGKKDPVAWMIRIAHNKSLNKIRDERRTLTMPLENIPYPVTDAGNGEASLEEKELAGLFLAALKKLSPQERLIFTLSKTDGLDKKEIARICRVSENTVRNQLSSAVKKMHRFIGNLFNTILV